MTPLKPFQEATVQAALKALRSPGAKRFLIADEVGLGKTVVAQHVIRRMMDAKKDGPLTVFYVCSNLSIASQNRTKLLQVLPKDERDSAMTEVDRLTLLPAEEPPTHPWLRFFTLTPDTSVPMRKGRRRDGRQEERALIQALVERLWPGLAEELNTSFFKRGAHVWWSTVLKYARKKASSVELQSAFRAAVRLELGLNDGEWVKAKISALPELEVIAHMRNALAGCAIDQISPNLVIFDEFQKFRDLLEDSENESAARLVKRLRGDAGDTALLLLSATPYRPFSTRWEEAEGLSHHKELLDLVEFLCGGHAIAKQKRKDAEEAFSSLARELLKGTIDSDAARLARQKLEALLLPIMSRTERYLIAESWDGHATTAVPAPISGADLRIYKHLAESFCAGDKTTAVHFWTSIPMPMQTMGARYTIWDRARAKADVSALEFTESERDVFQRPPTWPHPRLRALMKVAPTSLLSLPWMPPTLPWWPLKGPWADRNAQRGKVLVFSRFRATPQVIAAALSFELEAATLASGNLKYSDISARKLLQATGERSALLAYFHPSPTLARLGNPLHVPGDFNASRAATRKQILTFLESVGVVVRVAPPRPLWRIVARMEGRVGHWPWLRKAWRDLYRENARKADTPGAAQENRSAGLGRLLDNWDEEANHPLTHVSPEELDSLTRLALSAPGVVLARALSRFWPEALTEEGIPSCLRTSWNGLRTYFDQRWFMHVLGGEERNYQRHLQRAVIDGNLEAALDEYFWLLTTLNGKEGAELARELVTALQLHNSETAFFGLNDKRRKFAVRSHAALPFIEAKQASFKDGEQFFEKTLRVDDMRKAFNSPFYPHLLATTSVGQEGLDFHAWCATIVHWDLTMNPVDMEQREGRVQRYGGLSVRRVLKDRLGERVFRALKTGESPWTILQTLADKKLSDPSGLSPWWVLPGATLDRLVFDMPASEQRERLAWLKEQRLLYRLVLGQPNQEDLLEVLSRSGSTDGKKILDALPRLSAWLSAGKSAKVAN